MGQVHENICSYIGEHSNYMYLVQAPRQNTPDKTDQKDPGFSL